MEDFLYMLGVVAVGFALNFGLRAVPFLLFGGRKGELPPLVVKLGNFVSPVIIAALILYSYSGLQWRTPWPYLAGALTVALQLWKGNPLVAIVAGTALYMVLVNCCGCASQRLADVSEENSSIRVTRQGVLFDNQSVRSEQVPEILDDCDIPKDRTVHILIDGDVRDYKTAHYLMYCLSKAGYRRPILVTKRHGESYATGKKRSPFASSSAAQSPAQPRKIRYKKAQE